MTVSLDTAQAEVLQRSREDRGMKLIKLQIEPATDTRTLRIVGNGGRQERELGLREGESMSDGENRVTEMAEQTALKVGGLYKVTNPTSEHFGKVGVLRSVVSYADGLEIPSPKRPLWIEFIVWSGLHHCHTQVDFARDDVAPYEITIKLLGHKVEIWRVGDDVAPYEMKVKFKNGKWAHVASGRVYYAHLRTDGVWLYSGERPSFIGYCGVQPLDRFLADFRKL